MGTVLASKIIGEARDKLNDNGAVKRWPDTQLLYDLNFVQRFIATKHDIATSIRASMSMASGSLQTIPTDGLYLEDVYGNTGGKAVRIADKASYDAFRPSWPNDTKVAQVEEYFSAGKEDRKNFYVYPPSNGTGSLDIKYKQLPADITSLSNPINISDEYENDLRNGLLWLAFSIDSEVGDQNQAARYYQLFTSGLGMQEKVSQQVSPNLNAPPVRT